MPYEKEYSKLHKNTRTPKHRPKTALYFDAETRTWEMLPTNHYLGQVDERRKQGMKERVLVRGRTKKGDWRLGKDVG